MTNDFYQNALDSALKELSDLQAERDGLQEKVDALDARIEKVRQGALALTSLAELNFDEVKNKYPDLFDDADDPRIGITDAVKEALKSAEKPLTPIQVRERVLKISPAIAGHKNPMASIHAVLRRLTDKDNVFMADMVADGTTVYFWLSPVESTAKKQLSNWFSNSEVVWERVVEQRRRKGIVAAEERDVQTLRSQRGGKSLSGQPRKTLSDNTRDEADLVLTNPPYKQPTPAEKKAKRVKKVVERYRAIKKEEEKK